MDKALASGAGDCGFESHLGRSFAEWIRRGFCIPPATEFFYACAAFRPRQLISANFSSTGICVDLLVSMETLTALSCSSPRACYLQSKEDSTARNKGLDTPFLGKPSSLLRSSVRNTSHQRPSQVLTIDASKRRGPSGRMPQMQQQQSRPMPKLPKAEDDNPRFVIFIRSKNVPLWYPLNVVSGGTAAKFLVGIVKNKWGKKIYGDSLTRNIGAAVYKDEKKITTSVVKNYPTLRTAKEFEFGYKIVDEDQPNEALKPVEVILVPPKEDMKPITEKVSEFMGKSMKSLKSLGLNED